MIILIINKSDINSIPQQAINLLFLRIQPVYFLGWLIASSIN